MVLSSMEQLENEAGIIVDNAHLQNPVYIFLVTHLETNIDKVEQAQKITM